MLITYQAAVRVATELGLEEEVCLMHEGDKIGASAVGSLVRRKRSRDINPFHSLQDTITTFRTIAKHFSYTSSRIETLHEFCRTNRIPNLVPQVDICGTRIAACHRLLYSMIRLMFALNMYLMDPRTVMVDKETLKSDMIAKWQTIFEVEAVLNITRITTITAQVEKYFVGALRPIVR